MRIKITVQKIPEDRFDENDNDVLVLDTSGEKDIYEWMNTFKFILYFLTFSYKTVEEAFGENEEDNNERTEEDKEH